MKKIYTEVARPSANAEAPSLTRANLRRLEGKDPVAAALASVLSSMPPSETVPTPEIEVPNAKVNAWRRAARKGKERMRLWERCAELLGTAKRTGRRPPNHQSWNRTGCLENLRRRGNRRIVTA